MGQRRQGSGGAGGDAAFARQRGGDGGDGGLREGGEGERRERRKDRGGGSVANELGGAAGSAREKAGEETVGLLIQTRSPNRPMHSI